MTKTYFLIQVDDEGQANDLIDDTLEHLDHPLLTPVQENRVHFRLLRATRGYGPVVYSHPDQPDTLAEWLWGRYHGDDDWHKEWSELDQEDRLYWEHQAAAVRRAVYRGGFKQDEPS